MKKEVAAYIDTIIKLSKNTIEYRNLASWEFRLPDAMEIVLKKYGYIYRISQHLNDPKVTVIIDLGKYINGNFSIKYNMQIHFSKFAGVFWSFFQFEIKNMDEDNITGGLIVSDAYEPLTITQYNFYSELTSVLTKANFFQLYYRDITEVICGLDFRVPEMKFFGEQPNVQLLLFHDFFDLLDD